MVADVMNDICSEQYFVNKTAVVSLENIQ